MRAPSTLLFFLLLSFSKLAAQGDTLSFSFIHQDSLRSYLLYVPAAYDGSEDWPLVINYHQFGWSLEDYMALTQMNPVADTGHFLVAYPQGLSVLNPVAMQNGPGWNESEGLSDNDDVDFTNALIKQIHAAYQVDPARIYATGWGMGAAFSLKVQCDLADVIAATASVSNPLSDLQLQTCTPGRPVSILFMQGTADPFIPFEPDPQHPVFTMGFYSSVDFLQNNNHCSADSTITEIADSNTQDGSTVTLIEYSDCEAETEIVVYRINGGGHAWPGGGPVPDFFGAVNQDINASSEIWNFFNRNPHPSPPGQVIERMFFHQDSLRRFLLYVPYAYQGTEPWPVVINLHGYALNADFQMAFSDMNPVADTGHFLIVYPEATTIVSTVPNIPPQGLGWNVSLASDTVFVSPGKVDDVDFIGQVIDSIAADYQIAPNRIYATGFSSGGMMANLLGLKLNNRIAAIAPLSGTIPESQIAAQTESVSLPVFHIHGTADPVVLYGEGDPFLLSVPEMLEFWVSQNTCDAEPVTMALPDVDMTDNSTLELQQWQNCTHELWHLQVIDGGHQWPGGVNLLPFLGNFNQDVHAATEIWNFFNRHQLSDPTSVKDRLHLETIQLKAYPNPFTHQLTIEFELTAGTQVQLNLSNLLGQQLMMPFSGYLAAGPQQLQWRIDHHLPAGLYYLQLLIDGRRLNYPLISKGY